MPASLTAHATSHRFDEKVSFFFFYNSCVKLLLTSRRVPLCESAAQAAGASGIILASGPMQRVVTYYTYQMHRINEQDEQNPGIL